MDQDCNLPGTTPPVSPSRMECVCQFLSINCFFCADLVLLCYPTCSFRLAFNTDQFLDLVAKQMCTNPLTKCDESKSFWFTLKAT